MKRERLVDAWEEAVGRCDAGRLVRAALADDEGRYDAVIALGKVGRQLRDGARACPACAGLVESLVVTGSGAAAGPPDEVRIGEHPIPGAGSFAAGARALSWCREAAARGRRVLGLVSGGASALCEAPRDGISPAELAAAHRALVASGLPIDAMNAARRRLSAVKGGGLASALGPALRRVLVLGDVASADPSVVGSGPLSPPPEGGEDEGALESARAALPEAVRALLAPRASRILAPPAELLASPSTLARALGEALTARGVSLAAPPGLLEAPLDDAVARIVAHLTGARGAWVAAGEVAVAVPPEAVGANGGRARHLALAVRVAMARVAPHARWWLLAAGSDGRDGAGASGAVVGHATPTAGAEEALARFASGDWIRDHGFELPETAPRTNLTDGYVAVAW